MIQCGALPKLKAIFFEEIAPKKAGSVGAAPYTSAGPWFQEVVEAGMKKAIEVCTVWTHPGRQMKAKKDELGIPRASSARDMKTDVRNR